MADAIELTKALVPLAWPLIVAIVLWKLFPVIKSIVNSRSFTLKIAGMEVSVEDATQQLSVQIEDLQKQVIDLRRGVLPGEQVSEKPDSKKSTLRKPTVLWVDDVPSNNAFEIARLQEQNVEVIQALSTEEAMLLVHSTPVDVVISDMGRREGGLYRSQAGLNLLQSMRRAGIEKPFMVYSSQKHAEQNLRMVRDAGGDGATASPIELLEWLGSKIGTRGVAS